MLKLLHPNCDIARLTESGFRFGDKGTHTSRTMMFSELALVMTATTSTGSRADYANSIIDDNCLGKPTVATRRLSNQRLGELFGLDPAILIFRALRMLWDTDPQDDALLPLLCAIARDPLLAATAEPVIQLDPGMDFNRDQTRRAIRAAVGERLSDQTVDKVIRNAASSWTQTGHLEGRTLKVRRRVTPRPRDVAYAMFLAHLAGFRGTELFSSGWLQILDCPPTRARELALEAKRIGILDLRVAGDVVEIDFRRLERA